MFNLPVWQQVTGDSMDVDALLLLRCQNLQRAMDELGSADVFLKRYGNFFGEDKTMSSNHLFKLLSGKIAIRSEMAREFEQVLQKPAQWLDSAPAAAARNFGAWPHAVSGPAGAAYQRLPAATRQQLNAHADELVEQWSTTDWRHVRVIVPDK
jgi:hypothetical protein